MKYILKCIYVFIGLTLFSSCKEISELSVAKRHYRNGLYVNAPVSRSNHKNSENTIINRDALKSIDIRQAKKADCSINDPDIIVQQPTEPKGDLNHSKNKFINYNKINPADNTSSFKTEPAPVSDVLNPLESEQEGPFLSTIIWYIIAILVLAWLISLITGGFGLGGLIYILLVIALILLIIKLIFYIL